MEQLEKGFEAMGAGVELVNGLSEVAKEVRDQYAGVNPTYDVMDLVGRIREIILMDPRLFDPTGESSEEILELPRMAYDNAMEKGSEMLAHLAVAREIFGL